MKNLGKIRWLLLFFCLYASFLTAEVMCDSEDGWSKVLYALSMASAIAIVAYLSASWRTTKKG